MTKKKQKKVKKPKITIDDVREFIRENEETDLILIESTKHDFCISHSGMNIATFAGMAERLKIRAVTYMENAHYD